jgi:serine phosphatase RsbU (regulator of sigma subunit)
MDAELKAAREIQRALIPAQLPQIPGTDLAAYFSAAEAKEYGLVDDVLLKSVEEKKK